MTIAQHSWIFLALLAAFSWAITNVIDGTLASSGRISIDARLALDSSVSLITLSVFLPKVSSYNPRLIIWAAGAGLLTYIFTRLYYQALQKESVTSVSIFLQLIPVFSACIGFSIYGERFFAENYFGAAIVMIGAFLASIDWRPGNYNAVLPIASLNSSLRLMLPATFIMSVSYGLSKGLLADHTFIDVFFWNRVGTAACGFATGLTSTPTRNEFFCLIRKDRRLILFGIGAAEVFNVLGLFFLTAAYADGTLTLVATLTSSQPIFVIFLLLGLHFFAAPQQSPVGKSWSIRLPSVLSAALMFVGIYFLVQ